MPRPPNGSDPLSASPRPRKFLSLDSDGIDGRPLDIAGPHPDTFDTVEHLRKAHEGICCLHELPARCDCGTKFNGTSDEFRVSLVLSPGDRSDPTVPRTLCRQCYDNLNRPDEENTSIRTARRMWKQGATQVEIAAALKVSQPTVSRWVKSFREYR